jgi:hypothetical protein
MKMNFILPAVYLFYFISCGSIDYSDINYSNKTNEDIIFSTSEKYNSGYFLAAGAAITLSSDVFGRTSIHIINKPLITWEYNNGNVNEINFIEKKQYKLDIFNFTKFDILINEKNKLIKEPSILAAAFIPSDPPEPDLTHKKTSSFVYSDKPVFLFMNAQDISFQLKRNNDNSGFILGINPPDGEWWELPGLPAPAPVVYIKEGENAAIY